MVKLKLTLTAQTPLCVSERRPAGQFRESAGYVPGAVLRGATAALLLNRFDEKSDEFQGIFNSKRPAVFTNAYPASRVLPATAMSCKAEPGFLNKKHGVIDTLIRRLCFESLQPAGWLYLPKCNEEACHTRLEKFAGFYLRRARDRYEKVSVTHRLLTRVAINRRRTTAEDQLLYSPIVISEGEWKPASEAKDKGKQKYFDTTLHAAVIADRYADILQEHLQKLDHVGSGTSRGLGQIKIKVEKVEDSDSLASLRERREKLNGEIKQRWDQLKQWRSCAAPVHGPDKGAYFTIDFYADAVLKEHGWLPTMLLTADMLKQRCKVEDDSLLFVRAYSGYSYRGGWNTAWGLPKDVDVIVPMGSVFVFWSEQPDRWDEALLDMESWGIGERTSEGFGQVRICDEFHQVHKEVV
jgi:CRISPR-associated protein Csx10